MLSSACGLAVAGIPVPASQDFGAIAVGSTSSAVTLGFTVSSPGGTPSVRLHFATEFSIASSSCTNSGGSAWTCSANVTLKPKWVGLRQDAIEVVSGSTTLLAVTFLHGIGTGPQMVITPGIISAYAGGTTGVCGDGGQAVSACLNNPGGLAVDAAGNVYIADSIGEVVRKVTSPLSTSPNVITTVAGNGSFGFSGDGGAATSAKLQTPLGLAVDGAGNLYVADSENNRVRRVDGLTGIMTTVAGGGSSSSSSFGDGGPATNAVLSAPSAVAVDVAGNLYIADTDHGLVRKVDLNGTISTVAGGTPQPGSDGIGNGGPAVNASLLLPAGLTFDTAGNLYIADTGHNLVRVVRSGIISVLAGNGSAAFTGDDDLAVNASLHSPQGLCATPGGDIYIADWANNAIRMVDTQGVIHTVAGQNASGSSGNGGPATAAKLNAPNTVALGPSGTLYIADSVNNIVRQVQTQTLSYSYANTSVGNQTTVAQAVSVVNAGNQPLAVTVPAVSGQFGQWSSATLDCIAGVTLAAGQSCTTLISFSPMTAGSQTLTFAINTNSATSPATVTVANAGTGTSITGSAPTLSTPNLTFGTQSAGTASATQTVTWTNKQSSAVTFGTVPIQITGVNAADFNVVSATCSGTLAPNASCSVALGFIPQASGTRTGMLMLQESGSSNFVQTVFLSGTGSIPPPTLTTSIDFGQQTLNTTSASQLITLKNNSSIALGILGMALSGPSDFASSTNCSSSLAANASCTVSVIFTPTATGTETATLVVTSGGSSSPQTTTIVGVGIAAVGTVSATASPTALNFGSQQVGATSGAQTVTVTNTGTKPLVVSSISIAGSTAFAQSSTCSALAPSGGYCLISVTFTPTAAATSTATLIIVQSAAGLSQTVSLTGTGVSATPPVTSVATASLTPSLSFGALVANNSYTQTAVLANTGNVLLSIGSIAVSGTGFSLQSQTCGRSLAVGTSCNINVTFTPTASGPMTGAVIVSTNAANSPQSVSLGGTGVWTAGLQFVPVTPCRVLDTRGANGPFGGPEMAADSSRSFPIPQSACGIPPSAAAYSLNVTVIPDPTLGYLSIWPTGQSQPLVSTLNSYDGRVKANAAIVDAGSDGAISIYVSSKSHVVLDINGYFAPPGTSASSYAFYPATPCRVFDTREDVGPFGGPSMVAGQPRSFPIPQSVCNIPATAAAYSVNFTVVPHGSFGYLSTWPAGEAQPLVSTLNAYTGQVTANSAIVPAGHNGAISVYVTDTADVLMDINGYFAPEGSGGLALYSLPPCRAFDSRETGKNTPFSGTILVSISSGGCGVPTNARSVVSNATVVPPKALGFLSLWAEGESQPLVSTLNAYDGKVTSNLAIIPLANGSINAYASNQTHLILDVAGYFAP